MPLPSDETVRKGLIPQLKELFGKHPEFRPAHARGILLSGTFKPTPEAVTLSTAPQFNNPSTPIMVRFSTATGIPQTDADPNAHPRSFALRFNNGYRSHTDIVGHSAPGFPVRTPAEFLEFLRAVAGSPPGAASPTPVEQFLGSHPAALAYVQIPKPPPTSYATEAYFAVAAFKFTNAEGVIKFGRYLISPDAGLSHLEEGELASKTTSYLYDELSERVAKGPISFTLRAQIAADGDVTDNSTVQWPQDRPTIELGKLTLQAVVDNDAELIFDPIPRVQGIEPSGDPLLELRHFRSDPSRPGY
jgi:catalase